MELSEIIPYVEALVFASDKPLAEPDIVELINQAKAFMENRVNEDQINEAIKAISEKYESDFYPFGVVKSGGGWQFLTKEQYHDTVSRLYSEKFLKRLSVSAMETLSIIAYEQPVTKSEVEIIRGVNCDYAIRKLLEKELIVISGRKEDAPGQPLIYTTSKTFMDYFGINSSEELPKIQDILSEEIQQATRIAHEIKDKPGEEIADVKDEDEQDVDAEVTPASDTENNSIDS